MSPRRWDHPEPRTPEPQTRSHSHPVWIATWPPLGVDAQQAEQNRSLGLHEEKEHGSASTQFAQEDQAVPKLQGTEEKTNRGWGNPESKTQTLFHSKRLKHLSGRKHGALTPKESKSSFYPLQNEMECKWEMHALLSLLTHHHPISRQSLEAFYTL